VGAAVAGSAVTGFVQRMTLRDQRRNERTLRFLDERQESYARFLRLTQGFINMIEELDSTDRKLKAAEEEYKSNLERLQAIEDLIENTSVTSDNVDSLNQQMAEWEAEGEQITRSNEKNEKIVALATAESTEVHSKIETLIAEANEFYYTLRLVAAEPVRQAASKVIRQMGEGLNAKEGREAMREFEEAARKDLL
jgi:multidrug resistance efflux pump